jgi:hypothetical protein
MGDGYPYSLASDEAVRAGAWTIDLGAGRGAVPEWLENWDLSQELEVERQIEVATDRVLADTGLDRDAKLALTVTFESAFDDGVTRLPLAATGGVQHVGLQASVAGRDLAGTVSLVTSLILAEERRRPKVPAPWRRGSVLWRDVKKVRLHGDASQLPLTEVDFAEAGLDAAAPWFLDLGGDLDLPAMGSILLLLNERFPLVIEAMKDHTSDRPEFGVIRSVVYADVGRLLAEHALAQDDLEQEWPDDSLGDVLRSLVKSRFNASIADLRLMRMRDPVSWNAKAGAALGLLREPLK